MTNIIPQPFGSEREARAAALQLAGPPEPGWSILSAEQNRQMLTGACQAAGVTSGAFDARIQDQRRRIEASGLHVIHGGAR